jgi:hypothetical protein
MASDLGIAPELENRLFPTVPGIWLHECAIPGTAPWVLSYETEGCLKGFRHSRDHKAPKDRSTRDDPINATTVRTTAARK